MIYNNRGQISTEYLILVGFITFLVIGLMGFALFYTAGSRDKIVFSQLDAFAHSVIGSAESVYYAGEPSLASIKPYLPEGIQSITISGYEMIVNVSTSSGRTVVSYTSTVPITGTLTSSQGVKPIRVTARTNDVLISEGT